MKRSSLILMTSLAFALTSPTFAQRSHPMGPPPGRGPDSGSASNASNGTVGNSHPDVAHSSPSEVLSHNTMIADKIKALTGQDAQTACGGFKNLGQCVAAAHVAKNLDIPGGFDALKAKMTGTGAVNLGKAIQVLAPNADAKAEAKKANHQASDDMNATS